MLYWCFALCLGFQAVLGQNTSGQNTNSAIAGLSFPAQTGQNSDQNNAISNTLNNLPSGFSTIPSGQPGFTGVNGAQQTNAVQPINLGQPGQTGVNGQTSLQTGLPGQNTFQTGLPGQNTFQTGIPGQNPMQPGLPGQQFGIAGITGTNMLQGQGFPGGAQPGFPGQFPGQQNGFMGQSGFPGFNGQTGVPNMIPNIPVNPTGQVSQFPAVGGQVNGFGGVNGQPGFRPQQGFPGQTGFNPAGGLTGTPGQPGQFLFQGGPLAIAPRGCHQTGCANGQQCVYSPQTFGQPQFREYMCPTWIPILACQCRQGCRAQNQFIPFGQSRQIDQCGNVCTCNSQTGQAACTMRACPNTGASASTGTTTTGKK